MRGFHETKVSQKAKKTSTGKHFSSILVTLGPSFCVFFDFCRFFFRVDFLVIPWRKKRLAYSYNLLYDSVCLPYCFFVICSFFICFSYMLIVKPDTMLLLGIFLALHKNLSYCSRYKPLLGTKCLYLKPTKLESDITEIKEIL